MGQMSKARKTGTVVTFYSWKGGVGRTMALANIAVQLARLKRRVLMVDWDLEAPGLHQYFSNPDPTRNVKITKRSSRKSDGLMGLFHDALGRSDSKLSKNDWQKRIIGIDLQADTTSDPVSSELISLDLLPSGYGSKSYSEQLATFTWSDFFARSGGARWLELLRNQWTSQYDFVLIDSRTGLTDSGGICTVQMPHILVLVFTASDQSLEDGLRIVSAIQEERRSFEFDRMQLPVIPVLSRWDGENEVDIGDRWMHRMDAELAPLTAPWLPKQFSPRQILEKTRIPHVARFSFGEPLPVLTHSLTDPSLPGLYFEAISRLIRSHLVDAGKVIDPAYRPPIGDFAKPIVLPYPSLGSLFKGRQGFMRQLHESLSRGGQTAITSKAIYGLGGIGKTRAAVEYAWAHEDDYSALLFVVAETPEALRRNLASLSVTLAPNLDTADDTARLQGVLDWFAANPGWLLILDNLDTTSALAEAEALLAKLSGGRLIITSRLANFSAHFEPLALDVLKLEEAAAFLLDRTKGKRRSAQDDGLKAREIAAENDGLAIALEQAGAYIAKHRLTFDDYLGRWRSTRHDNALSWYDKDTVANYPRSVAVTWQTSVAQLTKPGRRLLERLAWLAPEKVPEFLLDIPIVGTDEKNLHGALADLAAYSLITRDTEGPYFLIHRLVQDVTRRSLTGDQRHRRLTEALNWIEAAFPADSHDIRSWPRAEALALHARSVAFEADRSGVKGPTSQLMNQLGSLFYSKALYAEAELLYQRALAISEKNVGTNHPDVGTSLDNLAILYEAQGRYDDAEPLLLRALALKEKIGEEYPSLAVSLNNLAELYRAQGRYSEAEPLYKRSLTIFENSRGPDDPSVGMSLNGLAELYRLQGRHDEAERLHQRSLAILEKALGPDHPSVATSLNSLAELYRTERRHVEAEQLYQRALVTSEAALGLSHPNVGVVLNNLALLYRAQGRDTEAEQLHQRALEIANKR